MREESKLYDRLIRYGIVAVLTLMYTVILAFVCARIGIDMGFVGLCVSLFAVISGIFRE